MYIVAYVRPRTSQLARRLLRKASLCLGGTRAGGSAAATMGAAEHTRELWRPDAPIRTRQGRAVRRSTKMARHRGGRRAACKDRDRTLTHATLSRHGEAVE